MIKKYIIFILFLLVNYKAISQTHICSKAQNVISNDNALKIFKSSHRGQEYTNDYDLKYHRLEWEIDPDTLFIKGIVTSYFLTKTDDFNKIHFDMDTTLHVDSVVFRNEKNNFIVQDYNILEVNLSDTLSKNTFDSITVFYHGSPKASGLGSFIKSTHADIPIIWTLSEPYGSKDWWPCKQNLNDKIDSIDIIVTTPNKYRVASNGVLISERFAGSNKIYHWQHRFPIAAYLIAITVTEYSVFSDYAHYEADSVEILNYIYPEDSAYLREDARQTIQIMEFFMDLFGKYPFFEEKYGHAQFGRGGMEHQTMSFMVNLSELLIAHELAHQWFGNKITCNSWQNIWLNEGFARYTEGLIYENFHSEAEWNVWKQIYINSVTEELGGSVFIYGEDTNDVYRIFSPRLTYDKGAMVLHTLRWVLGDSVFFQCVKAYINDSNLIYSYATTEDLKGIFEYISGKDLTEFFNDWIYREGYPSYQVYWDQDERKVNITLNQTQSHMSVDFFELPVPIKFIGENSDTLVVLKNDYNGQVFSVELEYKVDTVVFDPDLRILSKYNKIIKRIQEGNIKKKFIIYPNPVKETLEIEFITSNNEIDFIEVVNMNAEVVKVLEIGNKVFSIGSKIEVDLTGYANGNYVIRVRFSNGESLSKIIKI